MQTLVIGGLIIGNSIISLVTLSKVSKCRGLRQSINTIYKLIASLDSRLSKLDRRLSKLDRRLSKLEEQPT